MIDSWRFEKTVKSQMLDLLKRLLHFRIHPVRFRNPQTPRILVVQIAGIGDLILATPALDALREKYPTAKIDLLTSPPCISIIENHSAIDDTYKFDINRFTGLKSLLSCKTLVDLYHQVAPLRTKKYDLLISLNKIASQKGSILLGLLFVLLKIPVWIGRNSDSLAPYFDLSYRYDSEAHVPEPVRRLSTVALLGADPTPRPASLHFSEEEFKIVDQFIDPKKITIGLHPGGNRPARKWPAANYKMLTERLVSTGYQVLVFGGPDDIEETEWIAGVGNADALSLSGKISLRQSAVLIMNSDAFVCNNSGPMHIAAAVQTPILAIFDPKHRIRFAPWTPESASVLLYKDMPCSATDEGPCPQNPCCIHLITVDDVFSHLMELLTEKRSAVLAV